MTRALLGAVLVAFALLFSAHFARAAESDPRKFLEAVYGHYGAEGEAIDFAGADRDSVFSKALSELIRTDQEQAAGEVGALDFDPICMCQDFKISALRVKIARASGDDAKASVSFKNFDQAQKIEIDLVKTPDGWRIDDLHGADMPSLKGYLKTALGK